MCVCGGGAEDLVACCKYPEEGGPFGTQTILLVRGCQIVLGCIVSGCLEQMEIEAEQVDIDVCSLV